MQQINSKCTWIVKEKSLRSICFLVRPDAPQLFLWYKGRNMQNIYDCINSTQTISYLFTSMYLCINFIYYLYCSIRGPVKYIFWKTLTPTSLFLYIHKSEANIRLHMLKSTRNTCNISRPLACSVSSHNSKHTIFNCQKASDLLTEFCL